MVDPKTIDDDWRASCLRLHLGASHVAPVADLLVERLDEEVGDRARLEVR